MGFLSEDGPVLRGFGFSGSRGYVVFFGFFARADRVLRDIVESVRGII